MEPDGQQQEAEVQRVAPQFFTGQLKPVPISLRYKLAMFAVAVGMGLLPLLYLALLGIVAFGIYLYATSTTDFFFPEFGGRRHSFGPLLLVYVTPILIGIVLLVFLIKPLFVRWRMLELTIPLSHTDHPDLFAFIGQLCQQMGAPIPSRIDVAFEPGAHVGYRAGLGSFFSNDIVLTFGLPLAAGLNCQEFAGLLAHELGHCTQRNAMRCSYLIKQTNHWLSRVVYERDELDVDLIQATNESSSGLFVGMFTRLFVAVARGILWLFMNAGHWVASFMSRQMEFHADAWAVSVAGSDGFVRMYRRIEVLSASTQQVLGSLKKRRGVKLPDDLSTHIAVRAAQLAGETQARILETVTREKTHWADSHPSATERIARAQHAAQTGAIDDLRPATALFGDFGAFSRNATRAAYEFALGEEIPEDELFKVETPNTAPPDTSAEEALIKEYFRGLGSLLSPILVEEKQGLKRGLPSAWRQHHAEAQAALEQAEIAPLREELKRNDALGLQAVQAGALLEAGVTPSPETFPLVPVDAVGIESSLARAELARAELARALEPLIQLSRTRLLTALNLLRTPEVTRRLTNTQALQDEMDSLLHVLGKVGLAFPAIMELRKEFAVLQALLSIRDRSGEAASAGAALAASAERARGWIAQIQQSLGVASYPFPHSQGLVSLMDYAKTRNFHADPIVMTQMEAESHLMMLFALYHRVLARLVEIARLVEDQVDRGATIGRA
jgi:Zn-dependent protease with chaperone function